MQISDVLSSPSGDVRWTAGGRTICPSLTRSTSFEPCLTELERTKNSRNSSNGDAQQRLKPSLSVDQCRSSAADVLSTQPATAAKTSESTVFCTLITLSYEICDCAFLSLIPLLTLYTLFAFWLTCLFTILGPFHFQAGGRKRQLDMALVSMPLSPDSVGKAIMSSDCPSATFICSFVYSSGQIFLPRYLPNGLSNRWNLQGIFASPYSTPVWSPGL